jgi:hypothetical protein
MGSEEIAPPRKIAAHTWTCVVLSAPLHVRGEIQSAAAMPTTHWMIISSAKMRSVRS